MLGWELKFKFFFIDIKFFSLILGLGGGQFDVIIFGMYIMFECIVQVDVIVYGKIGVVIMVVKDGGVMFKSENDLCGFKVGL